MVQDAVISEVHKICDVLHFLEIREMSEICSNKPSQPLYNITFCLSAVHLLNEVVAD